MTSKNFQLGLKLWSTNVNLIPAAQKLYSEGTYQYLELFSVPGTYKQSIEHWKKLHLPYIIHAPQDIQGVDLSDQEKKASNTKYITEAQQYANTLNAPHIILHPGCKGSLAELATQIGAYRDDRFLIENMPKMSLDEKFALLGSSHSEIKQLLKTVDNLRFCLDIGHAIAAAHAQGIPYISYLQQLLALQPAMFHLNDGLTNSVGDNHLSFGQGNFPIQEILTLLPIGCRISLETPKDISGNLTDFKLDIEYIRHHINI